MAMFLLSKIIFELRKILVFLYYKTSTDMNERLKRIIFKKLDQDLGHTEIIVDDSKSIWFIDRANKFWYLELRSSGTLWWRYSFFRDFFPLFGLERLEYEPVIAEWVEEVLKRGVSSTLTDILMELRTMEEVFNLEVSSTTYLELKQILEVEEVLKREVSSTLQSKIAYHNQVEEVLNRKVNSTQRNHMNDCDEMEEALKRGVSSFLNFDTPRNREVGRALNNKVSSSNSKELLQYEVDKVLQNKIQPEETNLKKVLSLKAGVRECKMKIKKILKKFTSK
jgi:hypothetical protein